MNFDCTRRSCCDRDDASTLASDHDKKCTQILERYQSSKEIVGCWVVIVTNNKPHNYVDLIENAVKSNSLENRSFWFKSLPDWELLYVVEYVTSCHRGHVLTLSATKFSKPNKVADNIQTLTLHQKINFDILLTYLRTEVIAKLDNDIEVQIKVAPYHFARYCCPSDVEYCKWHSGTEG